MSELVLAPRAQSLLRLVETWSDGGGVVRTIGVKALVTLAGPLVILAGIAMLVLPGPGLVVMALGFSLLALEYAWARHVLTRFGAVLGWAKRVALPTGSSPVRKLVGIAGTAAFFAATTLLTGATSTYVASHLVL